MNRFAFKKIDAFSTGESRGNPAGCVFLERMSDITETQMQRIARELKGFVSEVVYLAPSGGECLLRYYSSECEVDFCGHGTVAAMHDFLSSDPAAAGRGEITIVVKGERLTVLNRIAEEDSVYINAPAPNHFTALPGAADIVRSLGTDESAIHSLYQAGLISCGLKTLIVPIAGLHRCLGLFPPQEELRLFCLRNGIDIILVFTEETAHTGHGYRTRVFAPKYGYLEDPATGSGNSAFGCYLHARGLWDGGPLVIEQGSDERNPNIVRIAAKGGGEDLRVMFGGSARVKIEGAYIV
jgi:PhzF family phenazine biosynthesis protein